MWAEISQRRKPVYGLLTHDDGAELGRVREERREGVACPELVNWCASGEWS